MNNHEQVAFYFEESGIAKKPYPLHVDIVHDLDLETGILQVIQTHTEGFLNSKLALLATTPYAHNNTNNGTAYMFNKKNGTTKVIRCVNHECFCRTIQGVNSIINNYSINEQAHKQWDNKNIENLFEYYKKQSETLYDSQTNKFQKFSHNSKIKELLTTEINKSTEQTSVFKLFLGFLQGTSEFLQDNKFILGTNNNLLVYESKNNHFKIYEKDLWN